MGVIQTLRRERIAVFVSSHGNLRPRTSNCSVPRVRSQGAIGRPPCKRLTRRFNTSEAALCRPLQRQHPRTAYGSDIRTSARSATEDMKLVSRAIGKRTKMLFRSRNVNPRRTRTSWSSTLWGKGTRHLGPRYRSTRLCLAKTVAYGPDVGKLQHKAMFARSRARSTAKLHQVASGSPAPAHTWRGNSR